MVNIISSKDKILGNTDTVDGFCRNLVDYVNKAVSKTNQVYVESEGLTPYGRALLSVLEELTGEVVSRNYVNEKIDIMFEDE